MAVLDLHFFSTSIVSQVRVNLIIPERKGKPGEKFPVLYLLHGGSGNSTDWLRNSGIARYAEKKGVAVVMPCSGPSRWLNMAMGTNYGDFVVEELPRMLERFFPQLSTERENTMIGGLSMGGGGALELAMMYPEKYAAVCVLSTSSVIPLEHLRKSQWSPTPFGGEGAPSLSQVHLGVDDPDELAGTKYDVLWQSRQNMEQGKPLPRVFHAVGSEDHGFEVGLALRQHFLSLPGNPYQYEFFTGQTGHCWEFWDKWIQVFLDRIPQSAC